MYYNFSQAHLTIADLFFSGTFNHNRFWLSCLGSLVYLIPNTFKLVWLSKRLTINIAHQGFKENPLCTLN
jgi:TRAP-type mannitol/chloroaromatic compound transport system permease small subunit